MGVGGNVGAIHRERRVAVAHVQIAQNLIVGSIFPEDVNHVANGISSIVEDDLSRIFADEIVLLNVARKFRETSLDLGQIHAGDGAPQQFGNVGMRPVSVFCRDEIGPRVGSSSLPFRGCDQKIVPANCERTRIPIRGNKARCRPWFVSAAAAANPLESKNRDSIQRGISYKQAFAVIRHRQSGRRSSRIALARQPCVKESHRLAVFGGHDSDHIGVGQRDVYFLLIRAQQHCRRVRTGVSGILGLQQRNPPSYFAVR